MNSNSFNSKERQSLTSSQMQESKQVVFPVRALSAEFENLKLSLTFDAITVYPKYVDGADPETDSMSISKMLKVPELKFTQSYGVIKKALDGNEIQEDEDDHPLFHQDGFSREETHTHIRFVQRLTRDQLEKIILPTLVDNGLLLRSEAQAVLVQYDERYKMCREVLDAALSVSSSPVLCLRNRN